LKDGRNPHLVHVGTGIAAMGEQRQDSLLARLPDEVKYVGIGVGRRWNRALMKAAAEKTGGLFTQINPDEPLSWRTFELAATLNTPRMLGIKVSDSARNRWLPMTTLLSQGEELCAVCRLEAKELPETVHVEGFVGDKLAAVALPVRDVAKGAGYIPRTWARLEIDRLLAEDAAKHRKEIVELSKAMYVMSPFTSLLVLESEAMYQQYKVDRGRKDHWALYDCPDKIDVVAEDEDGNRIDPKKLARPTPKQVLETIVIRSAPSILGFGQGERRSEAMLATRSIALDFGFPPAPRGGHPAKNGPDVGKQFNFWLGFYRGETNAEGQLPKLDGFAAPETARPLYEFADGSVLRSNDADEDHRLYARRERDPASVGQIFIVGNDTTKSNVILRQIPLPPGQPLEYPALREAERSLARFSVFDDVTPTVNETRTGSLQYAIGGGSGVPTLSTIPYLTRILRTRDGDSLLYRRPGYSGNDRLFFDLVAYAPGMNTSGADVLAVLETEAALPGRKVGKIDDEARRLFDKAREGGWREFSLPADGDSPAMKVIFDGAGRYVSERTLFPGIRERVVCDGQTLWHLYPDLHIGAKRTVSRFHRLAFTRLVPMALPRPEDLARGADLIMAGERTVAVVPHGVDGLKDADGKPLPYVRLHLVFDDNGQPAEQQLVEMPAKKVLARMVLKGGSIRVLDEKEKEVLSRQAALKEAKAPELKPDVRKLVVLPLPYRTREHIIETRKLKDRRNEDLPFDDALALFAADFAAGNGESLTKLFKESFHGRDQRQLGLYVLLAAAGLNLDAENLDVLGEHHDQILAQYLAIYSSPVIRKHASQWAVSSVDWGDGFLRHLAVTHALLQRWQSPRVLDSSKKQRQDAITAALDYAEKNPNSAFGFALLGLMTDRANDAENARKDAKDLRAALARSWRHFEKTPGLETAARYEQARALLKAGKSEEARQGFLDLYASARKDDGLLLVDEDFRRALLGDGKEKDEWNALIRRTARELVEKKQRVAVLLLARQCQHLDDQPLANDLLSLALDGIKERKEKLALTVAVVRILADTGNTVEAGRLLQPLLDDEEWAKLPELWRLAGQLAEKRDLSARQIECLEKALDAEYRDRPEVMTLRQIDSEYQQLLDHYQKLADAMETLKVKPPEDFLAKVVRTADRWRSLSKNGTAACDRAARILRQLGEHELAWDYLTTPVGLRPGESQPWMDLAENLRKHGDMKQADLAFASAFAAEPTNAQILWNRAQNLRQSGNVVESQKLLRQLAEGTWQPRFQPLQAQARWQLDQR
jgi:predicted Zn-dependent protease